jgi:CDP-glucose 4,6-dehydratase
VRIRNPKAVRPWQHVLEPLSGYLLLAERLWNDGNSLSGAWNFGPPPASEQPVGWIVDRVAQLWGDEARWEHDQGLHPAEAGLLKLDSSKAQAELGYIPRLGIEPTLEWVVEWYRAYDSGSDMRALTFDQIDRFEALGRP